MADVCELKTPFELPCTLSARVQVSMEADVVLAMRLLVGSYLVARAPVPVVSSTLCPASLADWPKSLADWWRCFCVRLIQTTSPHCVALSLAHWRASS